MPGGKRMVQDDRHRKSNQIKSNQDLLIVGIMYNDISLYNIIHLNNKYH